MNYVPQTWNNNDPTTPLSADREAHQEIQYAAAMADAAALYGKDVRAWAPSTAYAAGQAVVSPSGDLVTSNTAHTSAATFSGTGASGNWSLSATFAPAATSVSKWQPNTAYATGQQVVSPFGDVVSAITAFTSTATYSAANWKISTSGGTQLVVPSSVAGTGVSVTALGKIVLSGATSASVNGCFTSTYDNYLIKGRLTQASSTNVPTLVLRASGTDSTAANYDETLDFANTATPAAAIFLARANWQLSNSVTATDFEVDLEIDSPALAAITLGLGRMVSYTSGAAPLVNVFAGGHRLASAFDGFTLVNASALTGSLRIYGYNNG